MNSTAAQPQHQIGTAFSVTFTDSIESVGIGLVPTAHIRALVPAEFQVVGEGDPVTPIVVRTAYGGIRVDRHLSHTGSIIQIGAVILPPDGTGDINSYTLGYYTSDAQLAQRLTTCGVDAQHLPSISYVYAPTADGNAEPLHIAAITRDHSLIEINGTVVAPATVAGAFQANWWQQGSLGRVKMAASVQTISIGSADLILTTDQNSTVGNIIGGDSLSFAVLQQFCTFASVQMDVNVELSKTVN